MMRIDRRTFMKDAATLLAGLGLTGTFRVPFAEALEELASGRAPVLWLQGQSCSGCSVSFLNSESPGPVDLLTRYLSLYFHQTLSAATGVAATRAVDQAIATGGYTLVVEGAVPLDLPTACVIAEEPFHDLLGRAARNAKAVIAVGSCAAFGGIPAAAANPTGASPVSASLARHGLSVPTVNLPGCPAHPAWIVGNLAYLIKIGVPPLDPQGRPLRTYGTLLHDQCPHFAKYERKEFAQTLGEPGCLFKLGCQGVVTQAECSMRPWNGGANWCIQSNAPCAGCARPEFARDPEYPFYRLNEGLRPS